LRLRHLVDALPSSPSPDTTRSAAVFPPEMGALVASVFHEVSSQAAYLGSSAVVRWCCRRSLVALYRPEGSSVTPSTSAEPPSSKASPFWWLRRGEKGVNRVARVWGSCWCPWFGRRPRRRGEIAGESRLGREGDESDSRGHYQCHLLPSFSFIQNLDFGFLAKIISTVSEIKNL